MENKADLFVARNGERIIVEPRDLIAVEPVRSFSRTVKTAENIHQRRLAGTRGSHQRGKLAAMNVEVDAVERRELLPADAVDLADAVETNGRGMCFFGLHDVPPHQNGGGPPSCFTLLAAFAAFDV